MTLARNMRHAAELVLLPGLAALLPWPWCFRLFRLLCRLEILYREETNAALRGAQSWQAIADGRAWKANYRLVRLIDHAELYLSRTRSDRWMNRYLKVQGAWPASQPFLAVTFHWGTGFWALRHLRAQGVRTALLVFRPTRDELAGYPVAYWYGETRLAEVERVLQRPVIDSANAVWTIRRLWKQGVSVMALYDVPRGVPRSAQTRRRRGEVLGRAMDFPIGIGRLAADAAVPVLCFDCTIEPATGDRILRIHPVLAPSSEEEMAARLTHTFDVLLRENLAAWHLNAEVANFLVDSESRSL